MKFFCLCSLFYLQRYYYLSCLSFYYFECGSLAILVELAFKKRMVNNQFVSMFIQSKAKSKVATNEADLPVDIYKTTWPLQKKKS